MVSLTSQIQKVNFGPERIDTLKAGDYMILLGMHVTTREIKRWTWQSYWWSPTPNLPKKPSDTAYAKARKNIVKGAPAHYAVTIAYDMIKAEGDNKLTPYGGGNGKGEAILAYNPYLEAKFSDEGIKLNDKKYYGAIEEGGKIITNKTGMQTNCMSCHAGANYFVDATDTIRFKKTFIADTYVDLEKDEFYAIDSLGTTPFGLKPLYPNDINYTRTDFLWSIPFIASKKK